MLNHQNTLRAKLAQGETVLGLWVTLESPSITEIAVALGLDWVCIDAEHGQLDFKEILEHVRVTRNSPTTPLVRVQEIEQGTIKRVLDLGADGILVPQVTRPDEVERAVSFARYPPWGVRGIGGERATGWGMDVKGYTRVANDQIMVIPLMEHIAAGDAIGSILDVRGVDAIYFGPADYSASAGYPGEWEGPGVADRLLEIKETIRAHGTACGIMARDVAEAIRRKEQGFQMIGIGSDTGLLIRSAVEALRALRPG